jgi:hypothetical protein
MARKKKSASKSPSPKRRKTKGRKVVARRRRTEAARLALVERVVHAHSKDIRHLKHDTNVLHTATKELANVLAEQWGQPPLEKLPGWIPLHGGGGGGGRRTGRRALASGR